MAKPEAKATTPTPQSRAPAEDTTRDGLGKYYSSITLYDYKRPNMMDTAKPAKYQTIYLPLPDGLRDVTQAEWGDASQGALGTLFQNKGGIASGATDAIAAALLGSAGSIASSAKTAILGTSTLGQMTSSAIDNMIPPESLTAFVQQTIDGGAAQNPNPTQIFRGPSLRSYSLGWTFAPRSRVESQNAKLIIKALKQASLSTPRYNNSMAIMAYPQLAQVNFYPWDNNSGSNKHGWSPNSIIRYKISAITSVSVNYAPSNVPAFNADDERPAIITVNVDFKETEYMVSSDWDSGQDYFWKGRAGKGVDTSNIGPFTELTEGIKAVGKDFVNVLVEKAKAALPQAAAGLGGDAVEVKVEENPQ